MQSCSCNYITKESLGAAVRRSDLKKRDSAPISSPSYYSTSENTDEAVSTIDIPTAGLAMNNFSSKITENINFTDLNRLIPSGVNVFEEILYKST